MWETLMNINSFQQYELKFYMHFDIGYLTLFSFYVIVILTASMIYLSFPNNKKPIYVCALI